MHFSALHCRPLPGFTLEIEIRKRLPGVVGDDEAVGMLLYRPGPPAFMIELGAGGRATPGDIRQGVLGFCGVARELKTIDGGNEASQVRRVTRRGHVTFKTGGLFRASREPGEAVKAGEVLGELMTIWGT